MSGTEFRTNEEEVLKPLEECTELRRTLKTISSQLTRIEGRVKRAFPVAAQRQADRKAVQSRGTQSALSRDQALAEFDRVVKVAAEGRSDEAERILAGWALADLVLIAKEVGVAFPSSKPSARVARDAVAGKVRESVLLTRHTPRG